MKKILSFLLALVLLFSASGCKILELYEEEVSEVLTGTPEVSFEPIESEDLPEPERPVKTISLSYLFFLTVFFTKEANLKTCLIFL